MDSRLIFPAIQGSPGGVGKPDSTQAPDKLVRGSEVAKEIPAGESFNQVLGNELTKNVREPLKFSAHASARMQSRKINLGPEQMRQLGEAVDKAAAKGLDDTLILTKDAAFIVSVKNKTVVTAMDRSQMDGNVFTNIDGAVVI